LQFVQPVVPQASRNPARQETCAIEAGQFTAVGASDLMQSLSFDRTLRYVRYVGTVTGTSPTIAAGVLIGEQKKQV